MGWNIREGKLSEDVFGEYFRGGIMPGTGWSALSFMRVGQLYAGSYLSAWAWYVPGKNDVIYTTILCPFYCNDICSL